jgi:UDP-hydrolysing UDP-N-acetyl-D-glucosamine 2-epimerase
MRVCVFTGTRAEYGLLKPLLDELYSDNFFEVKLLVSGMHLSPEFGMTYREIEKDGFLIDEKVEILLSSDTKMGVSKAMGLGMISFTDALTKIQPDLLIGLGDRFELLSVVICAFINRIPVAHIHGGEVTQGAYDEGFRHSITKMSHLHFTSTEVYRNRVIQLGENPATVFNVGPLGLDNIRKLELLTRSELSEVLGFSLDKPFFVITYHPETLRNIPAIDNLNALFRALEGFGGYKFIFTLANSDDQGRIINSLIEEFVQMHPNQAVAFPSLGQLRYLSALKHAEMVVGNSSSGIIEMPYFGKPTVNIGDRQKGRIFAESIIQADSTTSSITTAIKEGLGEEFKNKSVPMVNMNAEEYTSLKILKILKNINLSNLTYKEFFDLNQPATYVYEV